MKYWNIVFVFSLACSSGAFASTTKVGNGDDGGDLEGGTPIKSGIIYETRKEALLALKVLNVQGVPGLGSLLPELEHSDLIMAKQDVHPLANDGDWESSEDHRTVYARTFAEPHAPTRFFPAALKLSHDQLIAIHTHEALHRALPPGVRENEDKVAYLTMAMTSSSANFDRISRVASTVLNQPSMAPGPAGSTSTEIAASTEPLRASKRSEFTFQNTTSNGMNGPGGYRYVNKFAFEFSPLGVRRMFGKEYEPRIETAAIMDGYAVERHVGPIGLTATAPFTISDQFTASPFFQFNLKSIDATMSDYLIDRDVYSIGAIADWQKTNSYTNVKATYTLPSTFTPQKPDRINSNEQTVPPVWSVWFREGFKAGKFQLGGIFEFHHAEGLNGYDVVSILRAGPEIKWSDSRTTASLSAVFQLNYGAPGLDSLGDLAGHGSGQRSLSASLARNF